MESSFTCPACGRTSHHPDDAAEGYCGARHDWTRRRPPVPAVPSSAAAFTEKIRRLSDALRALTRAAGPAACGLPAVPDEPDEYESMRWRPGDPAL